MQNMSPFVSRNPMGSDLLPSGVAELPTISTEAFWSTLGAVAQRCLTDAEIASASKMADRGWTVRIIAEHLFGDYRCIQFWAPKQ